jgi:DNA polymerase III subunit delta'
MDSLFDASFFDSTPVAKPAEKAPAIVGQLDIFGNVVDLGDVVTAESVAAETVVEPEPVTEPEIDPLEAAELAGELPGAPIVVDPVEHADAEALGIVRDLDPGDVLNDPTWEPDEPIDIDALALDELALDELALDGLSEVDDAAEVDSPLDPSDSIDPIDAVAPEVPVTEEALTALPVTQAEEAMADAPETDLFGEPISGIGTVQEVAQTVHNDYVREQMSEAPVDPFDEPETDLFGEPIVSFTKPAHSDDSQDLATSVTETLEPTPRIALARPVTEVVADQVDADGRRNRSVDALWELVIGQSSTVETLRSAAQQPVHAYLFVGPPGAGKVRAGLAFAASVLCPRGGCAECDVCRRTLNQTHPDLLNVEREGASISVDQAREIIRLALRSPVEGSRKVLVLNDFHLVTNAGPTLLKIIEEPPPSTIFIVLAEQITNELVTIASRCVQMNFAPLSVTAVVDALVASGIEESVAKTAANAAGGRLDRARLLATDPEVANRMAFWGNIPRRLDGTGAAASVVAAEAVGMVDAAAVGPLEARQAEEVAALDARLELIGGKGGAGQRKELQERHKRELKRLRDDEIRFGFATLAQAYRSILLAPNAPSAEQRKAIAATTRVATASEHLIRNPNINLLLAALFVDLSPAGR